MEGSSLSKLDNDEERRTLEGLLDAFGAVFSLEEIASAYCKAGQDANLVGVMLYNLQDSSSTSFMHIPNSLPKSEKILESSNTNIFEKSSHAERKSKVPKPRIRHVSGGTVSCILGKDYMRPTSLASESCIASKPLKLDSKNLSVSKFWSEESSLKLAKDNDIHNNIEEFLFKMLGDGFQLDKHMIRKVLGCCGYDLQKSMEKLLDLSTVTSEERDKFLGLSSQTSTDRCTILESLSDAGGNRNSVLKTSGTKFPREQKGLDLQHELFSSLFHFPDRSEEIPGETVAVNAVKRSKAFRHVVVEPLRDTMVECKTANMNPHNDIDEDDEGDNYMVLRKAVKEYRATMKEYYKAAVEAFAKGDHARAGKLVEEGQFFHRKAREADEESVQTLTEARNGETEDAVSLDLHNQGAKEAIRLLKCHLSSLSGISSMKYLKVIVETNDEDMSKRARKQLIMKFLEKESITWIEDGNPGTIMIRLDQINPKHLSFAKKMM